MLTIAFFRIWYDKNVIYLAFYCQKDYNQFII